MIHPIKHFCTITRHRHKVIYHCYKAGILWQGLRHDLSKYSPSEFIEGAKFYKGDRSPAEASRLIYGYSKAWLHHKGRNKHHFEYWVDYNPALKKNAPIKMPLKYVKEMFCDRVAASKIYQGEKYTEEHPLNYYMNGLAKASLHPDTARLLDSWLTLLKDEGEDKVFQHIKGFNKEDY
ncbi:MAG: DUF5662 family protein [Firmicutes bacterium]|nr:DUF5662 family protein [Bacillota bacterium]